MLTIGFFDFFTWNAIIVLKVLVKKNRQIFIVMGKKKEYKNMEKIKIQIMNCLKEIQLNKNLPESIRKTVPMLLLLIKTGITLTEMKNAIQELENEKKIMICKDELTTKITKCVNQNKPSREALMEKPTEDELFACSYILDLSN